MMNQAPAGQAMNSRNRKRAFPTPAQVRELPLQHRITVPAQWRDRNEHVNVQFYLTLYELGGYQILEDVNAGGEFLAARDYSMFDIEHHLSFRSEILIGDEVSGYHLLLDVNEKRFQGMYFIINDTRDRLACTIEYITAGIDLKSRRTAPFPEELKNGLVELLARHKTLDWSAPVCGAMSL